MAELTLNNVGKTYPGGVTAVSGASFDIADGEFIVLLVGPSGCGKSTILRMIAGLEEITDGEVSIGGPRRQPAGAGRARHRHGVPELRALPAHDGAQEHGLRVAQPGHAQGEIDRRIAEAARILDRALSRPQAPRSCRAASASASPWAAPSCASPAVFLFDEPLSNLDAKLRTQMRAEIKDLHQRLGATFVFVTHDQVEAMSLADRIVIMSDGKVEQIGTPMELYRNPASPARFVAEFIGAPPMNVLRRHRQPSSSASQRGMSDQKLLRIGMLRRGKQRLGLRHLHQLAVLHHPHPVAHLAHHRQIMADEQHRQVQVLLQVLQDVQDLRLDRHVERRGRLVADQEPGLRRQAPARSRSAAAARRRTRAGISAPPPPRDPPGPASSATRSCQGLARQSPWCFAGSATI
jgi:ABC-type sugar transport system ATPase subunit